MRMWRFAALLLAAATGLTTAGGFAQRAHAATIKTLYDFCASENCADGKRPLGVVVDAQGRVYGTAPGGGTGNSGVVYMLEPDGAAWKYKVLYSFCAKVDCADGGSPQGNIIIDADGALYGVTDLGGKKMGGGTVFRLSPNAKRTKWKLETLHAFCSQVRCTNGGQPPPGLAYQGQKTGKPYDGTSSLFGVADGGQDDGGACGGVGCGLVYKLDPKSPRKWTYSIVHRFCPQFDGCPDGYQPFGGLAVKSNSAVFGTAARAGAFGGGTLFRLTKASSGQPWNEKTMHSFCESPCEDGVAPEGNLVLAGNGDLYGTTTSGVPPFSGSLFKVAPDKTETTLYRFCALSDCLDGATPLNIVLDAAGDIYGITEEGGGHKIDRNRRGGGTIYRMRDGIRETLWQFCTVAQCADGEYPVGTIVLGGNGKLYGTTTEGGAHDGGLVYELTP